MNKSPSEDQSDPDNMVIWNQVCDTNPADTKNVPSRGGWTAIDAQKQRKRATQMWGPYGKTWALSDFEFSLVGDGELVLQATFNYPGGRFAIATGSKWKTGDEQHKKLVTDATTKALSFLGFNSDVFEGLFDDSRYVAEQRKKYKNPVPAPDAPQAKPRNERVESDEILALVAAWKTINKNSAEDVSVWSAYVWQIVDREFDVLTSSQWSREDVMKVSKSLVAELGAPDE